MKLAIILVALVCTVGLIQAMDASVFEQMLAMSNNMDKCSICQDVVSSLKELGSDPKTRADLSRAAASFCAMIPDKTEQVLCNTFVADKLPLVLDLVMSRLDSQDVCAQFRMCATKPMEQANAIELKSTVTLPPAEMNDIICAGCKWSAVFLEYGVINVDSGDALQYVMDQWCTTYIGNQDQQQQCLNLAEQIKELFAGLGSLLKPKGLCSTIFDKVLPDLTCFWAEQ